jgi:protein-S-isoprenylcysteine O-methyltransferase Ste14
MRNIPETPLEWYMTGINLIVAICVMAVLVSVAINFRMAKKTEAMKREEKSWVETGTMLLFFLLFYILLRFRLSQYMVPIPVWVPLSLLGLTLVITGCIVNIRGRLSLGGNWANQIRIYKDQTMVRNGVFRWVRHPLYASLIWMFYGSSLIYINPAAFLANTLIFIPMMLYRARQEEKLLLIEFVEYIDYRKTTGMFFPKLFGRRVK